MEFSMENLIQESPKIKRQTSCEQLFVPKKDFQHANRDKQSLNKSHLTATASLLAAGDDDVATTGSNGLDSLDKAAWAASQSAVEGGRGVTGTESAGAAGDSVVVISRVSWVRGVAWEVSTDAAGPTGATGDAGTHVMVSWGFSKVT